MDLVKKKGGRTFLNKVYQEAIPTNKWISNSTGTRIDNRSIE